MSITLGFRGIFWTWWNKCKRHCQNKSYRGHRTNWTFPSKFLLSLPSLSYHDFQPTTSAPKIIPFSICFYFMLLVFQIPLSRNYWQWLAIVTWTKAISLKSQACLKWLSKLFLPFIIKIISLLKQLNSNISASKAVNSFWTTPFKERNA